MFSFQVATPSLAAAFRMATVGVKCTPYVGPSPAIEKAKMTATKSGITRAKTFEVDELVYKECFVLRSSQVGVNKSATIETIASLLQDTTCNRFQRLGWSTDGFPSPPTMRKHHLIWVTSRAHIEMYQYPAWGDVVEIEHWCEPDGKIAARFDSIIRNSSTGEVIGRATSKFLMMNCDTRKLHKISGEVREEYLAVCQKSSRLAFPEENNGSLKKIPKLEEPADCSQLGLVPRRADLDMNKHVNNVTYLSWLLHDITIEVEVESDSNANTQDHCQFLHLLKFSGTNHEINRGRTVWRKLER